MEKIPLVAANNIYALNCPKAQADIDDRFPERLP